MRVAKNNISHKGTYMYSHEYTRTCFREHKSVKKKKKKAMEQMKIMK